MSKKGLQTPEEILDEKIDKLQRGRERKRFVVECLVLAAAIYVVFQYVIGIAFVNGDSMQPTLQDGELVVFYRLDQEYQKDDLVIFRQEGGQEYLKRIVAAENETVDMDEEGRLLVNEVPEERKFINGTLELETESVAYPYKVSKNCYFVLGDNRENSRDSRAYGEVKEGAIVGRVFFHLGLTK